MKEKNRFSVEKNWKCKRWKKEAVIMPQSKIYPLFMHRKKIRKLLNTGLPYKFLQQCWFAGNGDREIRENNFFCIKSIQMFYSKCV